ncbi:MAG: precorrin-6y C5,15-methyltransferase (decarboxylating) subunit CbiE [Peptococcaceae bacterium]|nr:precorrin-6y C5,15-methyltransferase (decarboxylating) subunit CbiE [Peptococcaceae bacterium]
MIIGCGPGGAGYLTLQACRAVESAEVVAGPAKLLRLFPQAANRLQLPSARAEEIAGLLAKQTADRIAVLVSGDTGFYSLAATLRQVLPAHWVLQFMPGISSVQAACALFNLSRQDMRFYSLHSRPLTPELIAAAGQGAEPLAILCGPDHPPGRIARELLALVEPGRACHVACDIGSENQKIWSGIVCELAQEKMSSHAVCIIDRRRP